MIWLILALMAALAALLFFIPLMRSPKAALGDDEIHLYRGQLKDIEAAVADGDMDDDDAAAARLEIEHRIVEAPDAFSAGEVKSGLMPLVAGALITVFGAMAFYVELGSPTAEDAASQSPTSQATSDGQDIEPLLKELEDKLAANPERVDGWELLGSSRFKLGHYDDAANAYGRAAALAGDRADLFVLQGESIVRHAGGQVSPAAISAFASASALAPDHPAPKFYDGMALMQAGNTRGALSVWQALAANSAADAPWMAGLYPMIAAAERELGIASDIEASSQANLGPQADMIKDMVGRLRERLNREGGGLEDWLKLARAEEVLGNSQGAVMALEEAYKLASGDEKAQIAERLAGLKGPHQ